MIQIRCSVDEVGRCTGIGFDLDVVDDPQERGEGTGQTDLSGGRVPSEDESRLRNICHDRDESPQTVIVEHDSEYNCQGNEDIGDITAADILYGKDVPDDGQHRHNDGTVAFEQITDGDHE